jgi:hypothetical protein
MSAAIALSSGDVMPIKSSENNNNNNNNNNQISQSLDLEKESILDESICLKVPFVVGVVSRFFLTGATGFLGGFILRDLLVQFVGCEVVCLVRGKDGIKRIEQNLRANQIFNESFLSRITVLEGNSKMRCKINFRQRIIFFLKNFFQKKKIGSLDLPLFGLTQTKFNELCNSVDAIVHNGALVNWFVC